MEPFTGLFLPLLSAVSPKSQKLSGAMNLSCIKAVQTSMWYMQIKAAYTCRKATWQ